MLRLEGVVRQPNIVQQHVHAGEVKASAEIVHLPCISVYVYVYIIYVYVYIIYMRRC